VSTLPVATAGITEEAKCYLLSFLGIVDPEIIAVNPSRLLLYISSHSKTIL